MNRLAVIIPFYKREQITNICFKHIADQSKRLGFDVITAGSEGEKSQKLAKKHGLKYLEVNNSPLSSKLNELIKACKAYDGVIISGSDDFFSDSFIEYYQDIDLNKPIVYHYNDAHVFSVWHNKLVTGFRHTLKQPIGVGRLFSKEALEVLNYNVYRERRERGLDSSALRTIKKNRIETHLIEYQDVLILDVKQDNNLTSPELVNIIKDSSPLTVLDDLGDIKDEILKLEKGQVKHKPRTKLNKMNKADVKKIKAEVLKTFGHFQEGKTYLFKEHNFKDLEKKGYVREIKTRNTRAKKTGTKK
jgi:glycosyltransferase involved in cell wall biosynthesis